MALLSSAAAQSTIDPVKEKWSFAANAGWMLWYPSAADGAVIGQYICSGSVYAANFGWLSLGDGNPGPSGRYDNAGATWGVNVIADPDGQSARLRGYAWGANIGWISFDSMGNPRVDLNTGKLTGAIWSANTGWIMLENLGGNYNPRTLCLQAGTDTDGDGLPDAWEQDTTGSLATQSTATDADGDGSPAISEYLFDTRPLDPLSVFQFSGTGLAGPLTTLEFTSSPLRRYSVQSSTDLAIWSEILPSFNPAPGSSTTVSFMTAAGERRFYRIIATPPLPKP